MIETKADARLITLCARFDELERKFQASFDLEVEAEAARDAANQLLKNEQKRLLARIVRLRATTLEGHRARGRTLRLWDRDGITAAPYAGWDQQMIYALVRDLVA